MVKAERVSVADRIAALQKKTGLKIGSASHVIEPVTGYSTGNIVIDHLTGVGGIPKGRFSEIAGEYSAGKTTLAVQTAAVEQRRLIVSGEEGYIIYLDHEKTLDLDYMRALGIDTEHESFIAAQPTYIEDSQEIAKGFLEDLPVKIIIWDSVSFMFPKARTEGEFANRMAAADKARTLKAMLDVLTGPLFERKCAGILCNHPQMSIATGYGQVAKEFTGGGRGKDNAASLRLILKKGASNKVLTFDELSGPGTKRVDSLETRVIVDKNKVSGNALRQAVVRMDIGRGFDNIWSVIQVLKINKLIVPGNWYYFDPRGKENLGHTDMAISPTGRPALNGESAVLKFALEHPDWLERVTKVAEAALQENPDRVISTEDDDGDEDELDNS